MKQIKPLLLYALFPLLALYGCESRALSEYNNDPMDNFDALWETLDTRYCYFESRGINWNEQYGTYATRAKKCKTVIELFYVMWDMLDVLNDGHVNLYTPFDVSRSSGWYEIGRASCRERVSSPV